MKIVEFYGLSGAGKSTLAKNVRDKLVACGRKVAMMNEIYYAGYNRPWPLVKAIVSDLAFALAAARFVLDYGCNKQNIKCLCRIIVMKYVAEQIDRDNDFFLIDEGIIQFSLVAGDKPVKRNRKTERFLAKLGQISPEYHYVCADISVDEAFVRLNSREQKIWVCSFDEATQRRILTATRDNFAFLFRNLPVASHTEIDMCQTREQCTEQLFRILSE